MKVREKSPERQSIERERLEAEAEFWRNWVSANGRKAWNETKDRIAKRRGQAGLDRLVRKMNEQEQQNKKLGS